MYYSLRVCLYRSGQVDLTGCTLDVLLPLGFCSPMLRESNYLKLKAYVGEFILYVGKGDHTL